MSLAIDNDVFSKAEFARRRNVKPPRVSQWLEEKKIFGDAIVGEGRNARIRESIALQQLKRSLDPMQMAGNGLSTRLDAPATPIEPLPLQPPSAATPGASPGVSPAKDALQDQILRFKRNDLARKEEDALRDQAIRNGQLTEAEEASKQTAKNTVQLMATFETKLADFATAISAAFKIPQRDVEHLLRSEFRKVRADVAADFGSKAAALPETVEVQLDNEDEGGEADL